VALCRLGILTRTPQRGTTRRSRRPRRTVAELVAMADVPTPFRALTVLYLDTYATRVSHVYVTLRHKLIALRHFWRFLAEQYPEITTSADVAPAHGRAFIPYAIARARERQRGEDTGADLRPTAHVCCSKSAPSLQTSARGRQSRTHRLRHTRRASCR